MRDAFHDIMKVFETQANDDEIYEAFDRMLENPREELVFGNTTYQCWPDGGFGKDGWIKLSSENYKIQIMKERKE